MHKIFKTFTIALTLTLLASCSSQESENKIDSPQIQPEISQSIETSETVESETTTESTTTVETSSSTETPTKSDIDEPTTSSDAENTTYSSISIDTLASEDEETIQNFCNEMCHKWGKLYNNVEETDFFDFIQYDSLENYLTYSADKMVIDSVPYSKNAFYDMTELNFQDEKAIVRGIYKDLQGAYGEYIFILAKENGNIILNDMVIDMNESFDNIYRADFVQAPYPDFWSDYNNYSEIENQIYSSNN